MVKERTLLVAAGLSIAGLLVAGAARPQADKPTFARTTIDLGVVVSDVAKAAHFYGNVLGFTEAGGFSVSGEMAGACGLTDSLPFKVRVFVLDKEPTATRLKIMEIPGSASKRVDNTTIGSTLGFSYLTVRVSDLSGMLDRLKTHQAGPVKKPYQLGGNNYLALVKDPDGNIIELIGPMN